MRVRGIVDGLLERIYRCMRIGRNAYNVGRLTGASATFGLFSFVADFMLVEAVGICHFDD